MDMAKLNHFGSIANSRPVPYMQEDCITVTPLLPTPSIIRSPSPSSSTTNFCDAPATSMGLKHKEKELTLYEEGACQGEMEKKKILSLTAQEKEAKLGPEDIISSEFAQSIDSRRKCRNPDEKEYHQEDGKLIEIAIYCFYLTKHYYLFSIQMFQE